MTDWITLVLGITDKLLDKTPDYPEKKRAKYEKTKAEYQKQKAVDYPFRDDLVIDNLRDELWRRIEGVNKEI